MISLTINYLKIHLFYLKILIFFYIFLLNSSSERDYNKVKTLSDPLNDYRESGEPRPYWVMAMNRLQDPPRLSVGEPWTVLSVSPHRMPAGPPPSAGQ